MDNDAAEQRLSQEIIDRLRCLKPDRRKAILDAHFCTRCWDDRALAPGPREDEALCDACYWTGPETNINDSDLHT